MQAPNDAPSFAEESRRRLTRRLFFGLPLLAGVLAARPQAAHAGTSTSTWKMEGNSDVDDNDFIGPINDKSLIFKTKNTERMRVSNVGRVGIGTTNPGNTLHVVAINGGITSIRGDTGSTDTRATGVLGQVITTMPAGATASGVKGVITAPAVGVRSGGYGVWGQHDSNGIGVFGHAPANGAGVVGVGGPLGNALEYVDSNVGVQGYGDIGMRARGKYMGIFAWTPRLPDENTETTGIAAHANGRRSTGIRGESYGDSNQDGVGPYDPTLTGVAGYSNRGYGVVGHSGGYGSVGVRGDADGIGVKGGGGYTGVMGLGSRFLGVAGIAGVNIPGTPGILDPWNEASVNTFNAPLGQLPAVPFGGIGVRGAGGAVGVAGSAHETTGIGVLGVAPATGGHAGYFRGAVHVDGTLKVGSGSKAQHVVTSPHALASLSGNVTLDGSGQASVTLPSGSPALTDVRYQLTAIGASAPGLYIAQELASGAFRIAGGTSGLKVSWRIEGVR